MRIAVLCKRWYVERTTALLGGTATALRRRQIEIAVIGERRRPCTVVIPLGSRADDRPSLATRLAPDRCRVSPFGGNDV